MLLDWENSERKESSEWPDLGCQRRWGLCVCGRGWWGCGRKRKGHQSSPTGRGHAGEFEDKQAEASCPAIYPAGVLARQPARKIGSWRGSGPYHQWGLCHEPVLEQKWRKQRRGRPRVTRGCNSSRRDGKLKSKPEIMIRKKIQCTLNAVLGLIMYCPSPFQTPPMYPFSSPNHVASCFLNESSILWCLWWCSRFKRLYFSFSRKKNIYTRLQVQEVSRWQLCKLQKQYAVGVEE